ncbi:Ig-like domain-containing protein [Alcanivorax sp. S6407]|uniref:Ig-like domain-containing protein n=1 Tax=Alcanivorax sp. S6407 TaxID=2926424 RepID=UPI001FF5F76B|nr:Ig-like domain-containing protein [Alcanivorax sp. S6407]MCK0154243.1 Ig-like domain-containing protein [Alcanivorax sp. S6407]
MKKNKTALIASAIAAASLVGCGGDSASVSFNTPTFNARNLHYTYPLDDQQQVAPRTIVALQFSHTVSAAAENFAFTGPTGEDVPFTLESVAGGKGVVLTPTHALKPASDYKVVMNGVTVLGETTTFKDGALNFTTRAALEGPLAGQRTSDTFAVSSLFPDDDQFKSMDFSSFRVRTTQPIDASSAVYGDTVSLMSNGEVVPALMLVGRTAITVDPKEDMVPGQTYELVINGVKSASGDTITAYSHSTVPQDTTSPTTGERAVLVTNAPPADPDLGCQDEGVRLSELTGQPINCVPVIGTLLQDKTVSKQSGDVYAELAFAPNFPDVTPLRVKRGGVLTGDALEVFIGGEVPVGFDSGEVTVQIISDATGYLFPNPNAESDDAPKQLRLYMDIATSTADARANGAFTQNIMHLELVGTGLIENGQLNTDAITVVEPRVLGVENSYGVLSFRMESYRDQENAPLQPADTVNPFVPVTNVGNGVELSWQPGNVADRMEPGEPIVVHFNEALDPDSIVAGTSLQLTKGGMAEPFSWELSGNALVITPDAPVDYGVQYVVTTTPAITDLAGNPLQMLDTLEGDNSLDFTLPQYVVNDPDDVQRGPFAATVYPGFPCVTAAADQATIDSGFQGACISSSPEAEQVVIDSMPIVSLPANRAIRVRFSQNMDASTITLGNTFKVEKDNAGSWQAVDGELTVEARNVTFTPEQPWEQGALYRYVMAGNGGGTGCAGICSAAGLPFQSAPLLGGGLKDGGPDMEILFKGGPVQLTTFQPLANLPSADVNNNFQIDSGEPVLPETATLDPANTPANATFIKPRGDGGGGDFVISANTGCGYDDLANTQPTQCDSDKIMYVTGLLDTEIIDFVEGKGVPVVIYPTTVALTNLDATVVAGLSLDSESTIGGLLGALGLDGLTEALGLTNIGLLPIETSTGPNIMRVRYEPADPVNDPNGPRTVPPVGFITETPDGPVFTITFNLLFDAPALSVPGLSHNVKSLPIDNVVLQGPLDFLPDGRLFIGLQNQAALDVDLEISLGDLGAGTVQLQIPPGGINLSYQSVSIQ